MAGKTPVLIMIQGHEPGARWKLQDNRVTTIGRSSRNQISLVNPSVSRFHCELSYINGLWYVADLNSKKGTFLNGARVSDREVMKPGDVIRLSKNVFKFDLLDETAVSDEAMVAIREASLGGNTAAKGYGAVLDEARRRHQIDLEEQREGESGLSVSNYLSDLKPVIITALVVAVVLGGGLAYGHFAAASARRRQDERRTEAQRAFRKAARLADHDFGLETLQALKGVARDYPEFREARQAAEILRQGQAQWMEQVMNRVAAAEEDGDYRLALELLDGLSQGLEGESLLKVVRERQEFTRRLAREAYERLDRRAQRLREEQRVKEAQRLYGEAVARIGLPQLAEDARGKLQQIRTGPGQPFTGHETAASADQQKAQQTGGTEGGTAHSDREDMELRPPPKTEKPQGDAPPEEELPRTTNPPPVQE